MKIKDKIVSSVNNNLTKIIDTILNNIIFNPKEQIMENLEFEEDLEFQDMSLNVRAGIYLTERSATLDLLKQYLDSEINRTEIESNLTLQLTYNTSLVETIELSRLMLSEINNYFISKYQLEDLNEAIGIFMLLEGLIYQSQSENALILNKKFYDIIDDTYRDLKKLNEKYDN